MIRLSMLGGVTLEDAAGVEIRSVLVQPKRLALLAFLASSPRQPFHSRDTLCGLFWPEFDTGGARAALNQSIYFLRQALGTESLTSRGKEEVGLNSAVVWSDVAAFEEAIDRSDPTRALELYRGDFLEGQFLADTREWERWVEGRRSALRGRATEAASNLAGEAVNRGEVEAAAKWSRLALQISDDDEGFFRRHLSLLDRLGDRAGAIRAFEDFADRMKRDYDLEVAPETRALVERIRSRGDLRESPPGPPPLGAVSQITPTAMVGPAELATADRVQDNSQPQEKAEAFSQVSSSSGKSEPTSLPTLGRSLVAGAIAVLVLLSSLILTARLSPRQGESNRTRVVSAANSSPKIRIAVLPFAYLGESTDEAYLADGMTQELISRLSKLTALSVTARTSVVQFRDSDKSIGEIGKELGVEFLVEGSVRRVQQRLRVAVQLVDVADQEPVWAQSFDGNPNDTLSLQSEIADQVAMELPVRIPEMELQRMAQIGTEVEEAYRYYLRGRFMLAAGDGDSFRRAREYFEEALELDPTYAQAWSGLSDTYDRLAWIHVLANDDAFPRAREAAERALHLEPDLAEAHASLARVLITYYWDSEGAEQHFRRAIELDPSNAEVLRRYSAHLRNLGEFDEARVYAERALELDPLAFFSHFEMVLLDLMERRYDAVMERATRLASVGPPYPMARFILARALVERGEYAAALDELSRIETPRPLQSTVTLRGYICGLTGKRDDALQAMDDLRAMQTRRPVAFDLAVVHLGLGDTTGALDLLEQAIAERDPRVRLLAQEPIFDRARSEPRFAAILQQAGFQT